MDLDLSNRVYIVAGDISGLGRATANCLVEEGARVVLSGSSKQSLETAVADLGESAAVAVVADNNDATTPVRLVNAAKATWGRLDGALIGVADMRGGHIGEVSDEEWTRAFETLFLSTVRLSRDIAEALPNDASLALVLSSAIYEPMAGMAVANSLERGLASLALELADELGPRGIRVNGLLPGPVAPRSAAEPEVAAEGSGVAALIDTIPMRRYGAPEEFGRVATFLLSPAASYITASMIPVDGGMRRSL